MDKHQTLEDFFRVFEIDSENIYEEVEGIEHHIGKENDLLHFIAHSLFRGSPRD